MAGWLSRFFFGSTGGVLPLSVSSIPAGTGIVSPWQDSSTLAKIAYSEFFHGATDIVDRNIAMTVAPIKRGRAIIVGSVADLPLVSGRFQDEVFKPTDRQPAWLTSTRTVQTVWHRMANTLDDLIFGGWCLWLLERTDAGTITDAIRIPPSKWSFDENTPLGIRVNGQPISDARSVALFQGPDEGIIATGSDVIRGARAMEQAWVGRVQNPIPMLVLHEVEHNGATQEEAQHYVDMWSKARTSPTGAVAYLPASLQAEVYGDTNADLFSNGRNNVRLDIANLLNLPASLLDGSTATASLTYVTKEGDRSSLVDWLEYWLAPIEARLSMNDITPHGQVIRFSRSNLTDAPNSPYGPETITDPEEPLEEIAA